jgi:hypothetical protein
LKGYANNGRQSETDPLINLLMKCTIRGKMPKMSRSFLYRNGFKTKRLIAKAEKLGIEIPDEWWTRPRPEDPFTVKPYIGDRKRTKLKRLIQDERYKQAKKWTELLAPIIGALTGIIGTIIGLIAILKK